MSLAGHQLGRPPFSATMLRRTRSAAA
jgi:hypothetical protein